MTYEFGLLRAEAVTAQTRQKLQEVGLKAPFPADWPDGIRLIEMHEFARAWRVQKGQFRGLLVLADVCTKADGKLWYHVSFSRGDVIPSYADREFVKATFIGEDRWAIDVLPERQNHVNYHPRCLHLWYCLEGRPFPEFSKNGMI